jgi:hypothetical protein
MTNLYIQEIAGHKLSDAVIERLPTLCTLTPGQRISYSEVIAFHNVIRGMCIGSSSKSCIHALSEMDMVER